LIYIFQGHKPALEFLAGYLLEKGLSIDNLFVFLLIFRTFKTPVELLHDTLFWGVLGAIVMRALFIFAGIALISHFSWLFYIFGGFLVYTGVHMFFKQEEVTPENNLLLRAFKKMMPITEGYRGKQFFVIEKGIRYATPLFVVLLAIETTDLIFAVDSIPAVLAITQDPFIVYTSNIFAILGLRSMFFALTSVIDLFIYLHYGLGAILTFVGFKMLIAPWFHVPTLWTLAFIAAAIALSIVASLPHHASKGNKELEP
jgi:tellurite resistance protein TerC